MFVAHMNVLEQIRGPKWILMSEEPKETSFGLHTIESFMLEEHWHVPFYAMIPPYHGQVLWWENCCICLIIHVK